MTHSSPYKKCSNTPHLGPVGRLPAPNIFPSAKGTFAKGKMFWNIENNKNGILCGDCHDCNLFIDP